MPYPCETHYCTNTVVLQKKKFVCPSFLFFFFNAIKETRPPEEILSGFLKEQSEGHMHRSFLDLVFSSIG